MFLLLESCNIDKALLYLRAIKSIEWHERVNFHKIVKVTTSCFAHTRKASHECSPMTKSDLDSIKRTSYRDDIDFKIYMSLPFIWSIESIMISKSSNHVLNASLSSCKLSKHFLVPNTCWVLLG
jgi:hypothetical protein